MSSSSDTSVAEALATDVVLSHIFQYLRIEDLLTCRVVNQKWHAVAAVALSSRQVYLKCCSEFLAGRMCSNSSFRFPGFILKKSLSQDWKWGEFQSFAKSCGKHVRRLYIESWEKTAKLPQVFGWFKGMEFIAVDSTARIAVPGGANPRFLRWRGKEIILEKLRCLRFVDPHFLYDEEDSSRRGTKLLCEELIRTSPALKRIENFPINLTDAALKCGKLHYVSSLDLRDWMKTRERVPGRTSLADLITFSESSPPLKSFAFARFRNWCGKDLSDDHKQEKESLNRIIATSKDSLTHLVMDYLEKPPGVFPKLRKLHIIDRCGEYVRRERPPYRIFPRAWEYSPRSYFPALQTLRLDYFHFIEDTVKEYFGEYEDDPFPTVTTLELACEFDSNGFQALSTTFPNVRRLRVFWDKRKDSDLGSLWFFSPTLKTLEIIDFPVDSDDFRQLESCITGFTPEVCENLRKRHRVPCDTDVLDAFRSWSSITMLQGLERFSIHFVCWIRYEAKVSDAPASPVSHWYAFDLMPNLKTQFAYDFKGEYAEIIAKALKPYESFVPILSRRP